MDKELRNEITHDGNIKISKTSLVKPKTQPYLDQLLALQI